MRDAGSGQKRDNGGFAHGGGEGGCRAREEGNQHEDGRHRHGGTMNPEPHALAIGVIGGQCQWAGQRQQRPAIAGDPRLPGQQQQRGHQREPEQQGLPERAGELVHLRLQRDPGQHQRAEQEQRGLGKPCAIARTGPPDGCRSGCGKQHVDGELGACRDAIPVGRNDQDEAERQRQQAEADDGPQRDGALLARFVGADLRGGRFGDEPGGGPAGQLAIERHGAGLPATLADGKPFNRAFQPGLSTGEGLPTLHGRRPSGCGKKGVCFSA